MVLYRDAIWQIKNLEGYLVTSHFHYYDIINSGETEIIIGSSRQGIGDDRNCRS